MKGIIELCLYFSGGIPQTVKGENFDSAPHALMTIAMTYHDKIEYFPVIRSEEVSELLLKFEFFVFNFLFQTTLTSVGVNNQKYRLDHRFL